MKWVILFLLSAHLVAVSKSEEYEAVAKKFEENGDWQRALHWYLEAFQANPERPEPLHKIVSYYRLHGDNQVAYLFAKIGSLLFPSYQFEEELSIVSYYTKRKEDGYIAASHLMTCKEAPWWVKDLASKNILYYVENLQNIRFQPIVFDLPFLDDSDETYSTMNPSILKVDNGYHVICRTVNYTQTGAKIFHTNDRNGVYRTRNFYLKFDRNFQLLSQQEIIESLTRKKSVPISLVQGLEDCRIFQYEDADWFTCTTRDGNMSGVPQIVLCKLEQDGQVSQFIPLIGPDLNRCEKNWLPFVKDQEIQLVYSSDPVVVFRPNLETGVCEKVFSYQPDSDFTRFRGSASPIEFDGGYLMLIHEVSFTDDESRVYLHRFVFLNDNMQIQKVSLPFTFTHLGVEFCCGMTWSHDENELVMTIGIEDRQAMLAFLSKEDVRKQLN